jgi:hypothetical protein
MRPTRPVALLVVGFACLVLAWLVLRVVYDSLPPLPWTGIPALLAVAAIETGAGRDLRRRITRRGGAKPPQPLLVSRMLALAKASSLAAAMIAGGAFGAVGYLSGLTTAVTPRHDLITAAGSCASALVLAAAALYLEYCCRVPGT